MDVLVDGDIMLYGTVGEFPWSDGFTARDVVNALAQSGRSADLNVRINSPGGEMDDGFAIYNALKAHPGKVTVVIDGIAASMATIIAMAGDQVISRDGSIWMIHDPAGLTIGNADDHAKSIEMLDTYANSAASIYAEKTGKPVDEIRAMMKAETWMTAEEAVANGFASKVSDGDKTVTPVAFNYAMFKQAPKKLVAMVKNKGWEKIDPRVTNAAPNWTVGAAKDLPVDDSRSWDGGIAKANIWEWAGFNGNSPDAAKARRAFLVYDANAEDLKGSYKLPFADVIDGNLTAVGGGLRAAASRLPQTDGLPQGVQDEARSVLDGYLQKIKEGTKAMDEKALEAAKKEATTAAAEIAKMCTEAGVPSMIGALISEGVTVEAARERVNNAKEIKSAFAMAHDLYTDIKAEEADVCIAAGMSLESAKAKLSDLKDKVVKAQKELRSGGGHHDGDPQDDAMRAAMKKAMARVSGEAA